MMTVLTLHAHLPCWWILDAADKRAYVRELVQADDAFFTSSRKLVILNNGIEFSTTYFIMLFALFFGGAGRYVSINYWMQKTA
ncbi:MAG: hypothetical protein ACJAZT_001505 [Gammaproteobacteria bacterium]|jgi:hypothetical protein